MIPEEFLIVEGVFPFWGGGCLTGDGLEDEGGQSGKRVLHLCQDEAYGDVMSPYVGTLN